MNKIWSWGINPKGKRRQKKAKRPHENSVANEPQRANTTKNPKERIPQKKPQRSDGSYQRGMKPQKKTKHTTTQAKTLPKGKPAKNQGVA